MAGYCFIKLLSTYGDGNSPLIRLFFDGENIRPNALEKAETSFVIGHGYHTPIENAKSCYTRKLPSSPGIYICSRNCDYIYEILNCGRPAS